MADGNFKARPPRPEIADHGEDGAVSAPSLGPLDPRAADGRKEGAPSGQKLAQTSLPRERQLELYRWLKLNRLVEDRLTNLYRQGKVVGGLYSSKGQEAISVGSAYALEPGDFVGPLIRNLGSMLVRGVAPREVMTQYMARGTSPTGGKDCNLHFGDLSRGLVSPISMLGALIPVMAGFAFAAKYRKEPLVALTYIGDGGTSTGDFHEGMNLAAVLDLPLVVIAEHNGYAYSTPTSSQMRIKDLALRAVAYGIPARIVDGNDVLAVYEATRSACAAARSGAGPQMIEVKTFRMKGHAEHDDAGYVPKELFEEWKRKDPIDRFERHLIASGFATQDELDAIAAAIQKDLDADVDFALASPFPPPERATEGVYHEDAERPS